jgi:predicted nuclease of predicted toxin-antitoxin system
LPKLLRGELVRLYLGQMFRTEFATILRNEGHDLLRASEVGQARSDDSEIMARVIAERRTLITLDEHFGDWAVLPLDRHSGVIRIKIHPPLAEKLAEHLLPFLRRHKQSEFENRLIILGRRRERWISTAE